MLLSIIITTYNRPQTLNLALTALKNQKDPIDFEVIVADDGSTDDTKNMLDKIRKQLPYKLAHVWHSDQGFRVASIRNQAIAATKGEYIIFLDGDCVPTTSFIKKHYNLAKQGFFVPGNRLLLNKKFTDYVLQNNIAIYKFSLTRWLFTRIKGGCNRILPLLTLPLGCLRKINKYSWKGAKTCNLAAWKKDIMAINGFNEDYYGWGYEDSDLVIRLINNGVLRKTGRYAIPVIHLWHEENDSTRKKNNFYLACS